jgi:hypothetical protein
LFFCSSISTLTVAADASLLIVKSLGLPLSFSEGAGPANLPLDPLYDAFTSFYWSKDNIANGFLSICPTALILLGVTS